MAHLPLHRHVRILQREVDALADGVQVGRGGVDVLGREQLKDLRAGRQWTGGGELAGGRGGWPKEERGRTQVSRYRGWAG